MRSRFAARRFFCAAVVLGIAVHGGRGFAAVVEFSNDLTGFVVAAKGAPIRVGFDDLANGTNIGGQTIGGATFVAVASPLDVVDAVTTTTAGAYVEPFDATNAFVATSGANVLSPGGATLAPGPDLAVENDDVQIVFTTPVGYFGFDHISQRADGNGFTRVQVVGTSGGTLLDTIIPISSRPPATETGIIPGGADFWGIVSDVNDIASIVFNEVDADANAADNNIGYDSLRFGAVTVTPNPTGGGGIAIPLPPALLSTPVLLVVGEIARRSLRHHV